MTGDVHNPDGRSIREREEREPEVDRDPRSFSSFSLSGSVPVSALTRVDFP